MNRAMMVLISVMIATSAIAADYDPVAGFQRDMERADQERQHREMVEAIERQTQQAEQAQRQMEAQMERQYQQERQDQLNDEALQMRRSKY